MPVEGEGTTLILGLMALLILIIIAVIAYFLIKKRMTEYTYQYEA